MKKTLLTLLGLVAVVGAMGQGFIQFQNKSGTAIVAPVTDKATGVAVPSTYLATLYAGTSADSLSPAINLATGQQIAVNFVAAGTGYFAGGGISLQGYAADTPIFVQVRAWDGAGAATWAAASTAIGVKYGMSNVIPITLTAPPKTPALMTGLAGFTVEPNIIPEPSVIALGLLGLGAFLLRRRS